MLNAAFRDACMIARKLEYGVASNYKMKKRVTITTILIVLFPL
jgi:hypothetical protein